MRLPIAIATAALLAATPALAAKVNLAGQVTYRERIALPDNATLEIALVDQTLPSLPPRLDVKATIGHGQVPLSFNLGFDDAIIIPTHEYALIASISTDAGLMFRNFEPYPVNPLVLTDPILIMTNLVGQQPTSASSSSAPPDAAPPAILDVTWQAISIGEKPILPRSTPTLLISSGELRAGGSSGCNSWFAQATLDGESLRLGSITTTLKACAQSINLQEQAYKDALSATTSWRIDADVLTLYGADGKSLMVFKR
jgi:putative lipoprotein